MRVQKCINKCPNSKRHLRSEVIRSETFRIVQFATGAYIHSILHNFIAVLKLLIWTYALRKLRYHSKLGCLLNSKCGNEM